MKAHRDALAFDVMDVRRILMKDEVHDENAKEALRKYIDAYKKYDHIVTVEEAKKYTGDYASKGAINEEGRPILDENGVQKVNIKIFCKNGNIYR